MNICVLSKDPRYKELSKLLNNNGFNSLTCTEENLRICDILILSVKKEYSDEQLIKTGVLLKSDCVIFSGSSQLICNLLNRSIIDYSKDCSFLQKNAELTAEAALSLIYSETKKSLSGQRVLVAGYGRISKALCKILRFLGAKVFVYARRKEIKEEIAACGYTNVCLNKLPSCDIILNTVPSVIFTNKIIRDISKDTFLFELASSPGGYEELTRVIDGTRLPGRILPKSAARVIFETIVPYFPDEKG